MSTTNVRWNGALAVVAALLLAVGCASTPDTRGEQSRLENESRAALEQMKAEDPSLDDLLDRSYGYVVFPEISEAALIVGGAQGVGMVFENDQPIGYAELMQGSIGVQLGGQTFSELIVMLTPEAMEELRDGRFDVSAEVSAVILRSGAAAQADFETGTAVFVTPEFGAMAGASVAGQQINFEPLITPAS